MKVLNGSSVSNDVDEFDDNTLIFYVNGHRIEEKYIDPRTTLACYIRDHCRVTRSFDSFCLSENDRHEDWL